MIKNQKKMNKFIYLYIVFFIKNTISLVNFKEQLGNIYAITVSFEDKKVKEYNIDPKNPYIFSIENEDFRYSFSTGLKDKNILFFKNNNNNYEPVSTENYFELGEKIYIINKDNLTESINIKVSSIPQYSKLNSFETINENQYFFIKTKEDSIAYFDSFDRNSKIYISNNTEKKITSDDIKINGIFYPIKPNITYFIKNELYENTISVFKKYLYPSNLANEEIQIIDDNINYLYLKVNSTYTLNFEKNNMILTMLLSSKTDSEIEIQEPDDIAHLNKEYSFYGEIKKNNYKELILNVKKNDAFIQFLSGINENDIQIFEANEDKKKGEEKVLKNIITINIDKTQKIFNLNLFLSDNGDNFNYSLSLGPSTYNDKSIYRYIYTSNSNSKINSKGSSINLEYSGLYKYFDYPEDEDFISFSIFIDKKEEAELYISYELEPVYPIVDDNLFHGFDFEKSSEMIELFNYLFNIYVYTDIAKNPPKIPGFTDEKIDLKEKLEEIDFGNDEQDRPLYELYQDLKKLTCSTKDLHFNFNFNQFEKYSAFLPFNFKIEKPQNGNEFRVFIEKNANFQSLNDEKVKELIESHLNIPLRKINDIDPFEYIQNWSQYLSAKNIHAQFTFIIDRIPEFSLSNFPVDILNLTSNEYEFDDNQILKMNYDIYKMKDDEFDKYLMSNAKKNRYLFEMPSLGEIKENFLISKGLKQNVKTEEKLNWNFKIEEEHFYLKCRVDTINKVNVFVQNSFNMDYLQSIRTILNCARLFYSNNFPIIIIESKNSGGTPNLAKIMIQVFQILNVERSYNSYRAPYHNQYFKEKKADFIDPESCKIIDFVKDLPEGSPVYYKYDNEEIEHRRTKPMQEINLQVRKALNNFREEFKNSPFLKKPTEIIIFTDSFSFSATSTFIKGFQNIGGAIIVGYFGNPKIEGTDLFDSSQSDSSITNAYVSESLNIDLDIEITVQEIFDDYKDENPIPREYSFNKVDYRVDIYSKYSDDIYSDFIKEGNKIFNKFKDGNYCNSENEKIIIPDKNCRNLGEHLHGGYKCKKEKDEWDKSKCIPYYCDIGYYFDKYEQKCIKECTYENEVYYLYEDNYTNEFTIQKNETYEFFTYNPDNYAYSFQVSDNCIIREIVRNGKPNVFNQSRIYFHSPESENDFIIIKNCSDNSKIKIDTIKLDFELMELKSGYFLLDFEIIQKKKILMTFEGYMVNILYIKNFLNNKIKIAKFKDEMSYKDILNLNETYFTDYKEELITFEKDEIYIIYLDNNKFEQNEIQFYLNKEESEKEVSLSHQNYLYFKKDNKYKILNPDINILLKLSRKTLDSEIKSIDGNISLNHSNLYYNASNSKEFELNINNNNAFIEILYKLSDSYEELEFEKLEFNLSNDCNIIKIPKQNYTNKIINFEIIGNDKSEYLIYHDYTILPYFHKYEEGIKMSLNKFNFSIEEPYLDSITLMENEFYYVMIKKNDEELKVFIKIENKTENYEEEKDNDKLSWWKITLIIIFSIIFLIFIILLILYIRGKRGISSKSLEENLNNVGEINEINEIEEK